MYGDDEWALLQAYNVYRPPEYVPIAGPLSLVEPSLSHWQQKGRITFMEQKEHPPKRPSKKHKQKKRR